jgi:hypothetical protein
LDYFSPSGLILHPAANRLGKTTVALAPFAFFRC